MMACGGGILERGGEGSGRYARKAKTDTRCDFGAGGGGGQTKNELVQLDLFTLTHLIFSHGARRPDLPAVVVGRCNTTRFQSWRSCEWTLAE